MSIIIDIATIAGIFLFVIAGTVGLLLIIPTGKDESIYERREKEARFRKWKEQEKYGSRYYGTEQHEINKFNKGGKINAK